MVLVQTIVYSLVLLYPAWGIPSDCSNTCQLEQVIRYFEALDRVSQEGSTVADIDALLEGMHESVRYEHVEYEANFTRDTWRQAFVRNWERGSYSNGPEAKIGVLNIIHGKNYAAVEYANGTVTTDGRWEGSESLLVLFQFTDGQISLVRELW